MRGAAGKARGGFALWDFFCGQVVVIGKPVATAPEPTWETVQVGVNHHLKIDEPFERVNHSCDPNCGLRLNEWGGFDLVAMRGIFSDDEIVWDYCISEWVVVAMTDSCRCGAAICRGVIRGAQFLSPDVIARCAGFFAPYPEKLLCNDDGGVWASAIVDSEGDMARSTRT